MTSSPRPLVVITGAGSGIGEACARLFSSRGWTVALIGRQKSKLDKIAAELDQALVLPCDVGQADQVKKAAQAVLSHPGVRVEALINNAGVFDRHLFMESSDAFWLEQFQINLMGSVRWAQALWPRFVEQKRGAIVNVSSTLGLRPTAETGTYSAVKAAMINWSQSLALEGGPLGIRVNCVCPGLVDTPIHSFHLQAGAEKENSLKSLAGLQPLQRVGKPEEIARSIHFLADPEQSSWTTGAVLSVDGGINLT